MKNIGLEIWTVYDHPKDWPNGYVARKWIGLEPTGDTIHSDTLDDLRTQLRSMNLVCVSRSQTDDPVIVETWL